MYKNEKTIFSKKHPNKSVIVNKWLVCFTNPVYFL